MIKRILNYNNEEDRAVLSQPSVEVTDFNSGEYKQLIQDLKDTFNIIQDARGISAIQIGVPLRVCVCKWGNMYVVLTNPTFTRVRGSQDFVEGCLSVPFVYKKINRYQKVWCSYKDENGNDAEIAEGGRMSDIIQHEVDHMNGKCLLYEEEKIL